MLMLQDVFSYINAQDSTISLSFHRMYRELAKSVTSNNGETIIIFNFLEMGTTCS